MSDLHTVQARLTVFGHPATDATLSVLPRSTGWRAARAGALTGGGLILAPVVAILPPHVAWALASAVTGSVLGWTKWQERYTLTELSGKCPRCGEPISITSPTRLRSPWTVSCDACHHPATLEVDSSALPGRGTA